MASSVTPIRYDNSGYAAVPMEMMPAGLSYSQAPIQQADPPMGDIINAILAVQRNPNVFSNDEIERAREYSMMYLGKDLVFKDDIGRAAKNAVFDFVDTLAFGAIPDKMGPNKLTQADEIAGMIGGGAGFFMPGVGPMATGSRLAKHFLPSVAKVGAEGGMVSKLLSSAGEGTGKVVTDVANKGLGVVNNFLTSPNTVARVGSAIGGGFNFEDGINPMGAVLGAIFPMGVKGGNKSVSQVMDDAVKDVTSPTLKSLTKEELMAREVNALFPKNTQMVNVGTKQPIPSVTNSIPYTYHPNPTVPGFAPATSPVSRVYAPGTQPVVSKVDEVVNAPVTAPNVTPVAKASNTATIQPISKITPEVQGKMAKIISAKTGKPLVDVQYVIEGIVEKNPSATFDDVLQFILSLG